MAGDVKKRINQTAEPFAYWQADGTTTIVASASRVTTTNHTGFNVRTLNAVTIDPDVTVVTGSSPTLDLAVQGANEDVSAQYVDLTATDGTVFAQEVGVADPDAKVFATRGFNFIRIRAVIGGSSPDFTYVVLLTKA